MIFTHLQVEGIDPSKNQKSLQVSLECSSMTASSERNRLSDFAQVKIALHPSWYHVDYEFLAWVQQRSPPILQRSHHHRRMNRPRDNKITMKLISKVACWRSSYWWLRLAIRFDGSRYYAETARNTPRSDWTRIGSVKLEPQNKQYAKAL